MSEFSRILTNFLKREDGPTAVEYAVMLGFVILMCFTAITAIGANTKEHFQQTNTAFAGS